jgi:uncharacterized protein (TIGR02246 family)
MKGAAEEVIARLVSAWNSGDAERFSGLFTPRADYVSTNGDWLKGRSAIRELLMGAALPAPVRVEGDISVHRHADAQTAVFRWARVGEADRRGIISCVIVRQRARWLIDRLQNTEVARLEGSATERPKRRKYLSSLK